MGQYILTGAGFSKNWGGWLSQELWAFLIGHAEIQKNEALKKLLWNNLNEGFENALYEAKQLAESNPEWMNHYASLQKVVSEAFNEMFDLFKDISNTFGQGDYAIQEFLAKFDAIFTTNQDMLVELKFINLCNGDSHRLVGRNNISGLYSPGIKSRNPQSFRGTSYQMTFDAMDVNNRIQYPDPSGMSNLPNNLVPYIKLHGSSNWRTQNVGDNLMIVGGKKAEQIEANPLITSYFNFFRKKLFEPGSRLLVLGHSFLDFHINEIIFKAIKEYGLKFYIWNNSGLGPLMERLKNTPYYDEELFKKGFVGVSTKPLIDILKNHALRESEFNRVNREFFGNI